MRALVILSLILPLNLTAPPLHAEGLSRQAMFEHSTVRLLDGGLTNATWTAGVEIEMGGEWKTYWKVPGDAGVPPDFDWSGSRNLASVDVSWPAPRRYRDDAGESIGYKHHIVFPLTIVPKDPVEPVAVHLKLFYAVCDNICIPGQAEVAIELRPDNKDGPDSAVIREFARRVPVEDDPSLRITEIGRAENAQDRVGLSVSVAGLSDPGKADIFISGLATAYVLRPEHIAKTNGVDVFHLGIDGPASYDELKGKPVEIVVVTPDTAVVRKQTLN